jgi:hypothetical protein
MPVGTACDSVASDRIMPPRSGLESACNDARTASQGTSAARWANSRNAGRRKISGRQRGIGAVLDEEPIHLRGRDAVRQRGGDEAARRDPDVDVEVAEVDAFERVGEREQRADLVDAAEGPPPASARPTRDGPARTPA